MSCNELKFSCPKEEDTANLGRKIALLAQKGDIFALFGTLGMGKSVFSRAFIQQLCGKTEVPSPTFTLVQMYETPDLDIYHFDLYRLKSAEEIFELGIEEAMYEGVCLIEWPEKMGGYLPLKAIKVEIIPLNQGREVKITFNDEKTYQRFSSLEGNK